MAGTAPSSSDCVAYYKFEETSGTTADNAEGTAALDGTISGCTLDQTGKIDKCFSFDGVNDQVYVSHNTALDFGSGDFSINVWVYRTGYGSSGSYICDRRVSLKGFRMLFNRLTGELLFDIVGSASATATTGNDFVSLNTWTMLTFIRSGNNIYIHKDGNSTASASATASIGDIDDGSPTLRIGLPRDSNSNYGFKGSMDEIAIFNTALTSDNLTNLYNGGSPTSAQQYPFSGSATPVYNAISFGANF
jgi:hypothetical protein